MAVFDPTPGSLQIEEGASSQEEPRQSRWDDARRNRNERTRSSDGRLTTREVGARSLKPIFFVNVAIVVGLFMSHKTAHYWKDTAGIETGLGQLTGLLATFLILVQIALIGRNPWLDRAVGMDRLVKWHRTLGKVAFYFLIAHVGLTVVGYAGSASILHEVKVLVMDTRDMMMATVAFIFICMVVVTSIRTARRRMKYETWYYVHLYAYLGIALAVPHQIYMGRDFIGNPVTQAYWALLYGLTVSSLVYFRLWMPIARSFRHRYRVSEVVQESENVVSVYIGGRNLSALPAASGQFMIWRFLTKDRWSQAHPFSLSAAPNSDFLRISVKDLGDGSGSMRNIPVGTRVIAEGPYGLFTSRVRSRRRVVLVAGGIGITPIRALAETVPARRGDITLIYRANTAQEMVFPDELHEIARERDIEVHKVLGDRTEYPANIQPFSPRHFLQLAPDISESDVYVCGPPPMTQTVVSSLRTLGLEDSQIHYESFEF